MKELHVFYINLDRCPDRREYFEGMVRKEQEKLGDKLKLVVHRVDAVDIQDSERINKLVPTLKHRDATLACTLSHRLALQTAHAMDLDHCLICEDDCFLNISWNVDLFLQSLENQPEDLEIWQLFTSSPRNAPLEPFVERTWNAWATVAYIVSKSHIQRIINNIPTTEHSVADVILYKENKTYVSLLPFATSTLHTVSTIHPSHDESNERRIQQLWDRWINHYGSVSGIDELNRAANPETTRPERQTPLD